MKTSARTVPRLQVIALAAMTCLVAIGLFTRLGHWLFHPYPTVLDVLAPLIFGPAIPGTLALVAWLRAAGLG